MPEWRDTAGCRPIVGFGFSGDLFERQIQRVGDPLANGRFVWERGKCRRRGCVVRIRHRGFERAAAGLRHPPSPKAIPIKSIGTCSGGAGSRAPPERDCVPLRAGSVAARPQALNRAVCARLPAGNVLRLALPHTAALWNGGAFAVEDGGIATPDSAYHTAPDIR